ncbi:MAG: DUF6518 family protein [Marmoricola sp.]
MNDVRRLLILPVLAGLALGVGDLVVMTHVDYPWADLANSSAVWAVSAFVLGAALRTSPERAAVAGAVMLVVAVEAYYGYAAMTGLAGWASLTSSVARMWDVFGVIAGVVFGVAGAWTTGSVWWQRVLGAATGGGVLLGEALHTWTQDAHADGPFRASLDHTAWLMLVLGTLTVVLSARSPRVAVPAVTLAVPTALFCAAAFTAVGIAY